MEEEKASQASPRALFWFGLCLVLSIAFFARGYQLTLRPLHNDEGVNYHFISKMRKTGHYAYSHVNYHGPSYFYLTRFVMDSLEGSQHDSEISLRASAVLVGALLPLLLLPLRRSEGGLFVLLSGTLIALSTALVFFSRYAIHESLFAFASLWMAVSSYLWLTTQQRRYLYSCFASLALLVGTKETFVIAIFCVFGASLSIAPGRDILRTLAHQRRDLIGGAALCLFLLVLQFTGGFQWPEGVIELARGVPQWVGRNSSEIGHHKPFWWYAQVIRITEPQLVLIFALPALVGVLGLLSVGPAGTVTHGRRGFALVRFMTVWCLLGWLVYSMIQYKTPWLAINFILPATIAIGWWLAHLLRLTRSLRTGLRGMVAAGVVAILWTSAYYSYVYNIRTPYGLDNPYSYANAGQGMLDFLADMDAYWERNPGAQVLVGTTLYQPLPYYFRNRQGFVHYSKVDKPKKYLRNYQVLLLDKQVSWQRPRWEKRPYRLSDVQDCFGYFLTKARDSRGGRQ